MRPPCLLDVTAAQYHADPCPAPSLSASIATALLNESPLHAWLRHPKLGGAQAAKEEPTEEMDHGSIVHTLLFGKGAGYELVRADSFRTAAARDKRDAARAEGRIPILEHKFADLERFARDLAAEVRGAGFDLTEFRAEAAMVWEEPTPLGPVLCRGMTDAIHLGRGVLLDLKKTCADPKLFARKAIDFGYDVQFAAYTSALRQIAPDLAGREDFVWLLAEQLPEGAPKRVLLTVARPDGTLAEHGRLRWERACGRWAQCLTANHWPGYADGPVRIEPPAWAVRDEFGAVAVGEE